jgi:hypothetical protein
MQFTNFTSCIDSGVAGKSPIKIFESRYRRQTIADTARDNPAPTDRPRPTRPHPKQRIPVPTRGAAIEYRPGRYPVTPVIRAKRFPASHTGQVPRWSLRPDRMSAVKGCARSLMFMPIAGGRGATTGRHATRLGHLARVAPYRADPRRKRRSRLCPRLNRYRPTSRRRIRWNSGRSR